MLPPGVTSGGQRSGSASEEPFVACEHPCEAVSVSSKEECVVSGTVSLSFLFFLDRKFVKIA